MIKVVHCKHESFDVLIDRTTKWGNPFRLGEHGNRGEIILKYEAWLLGIISAPNGKRPPSLEEITIELADQVLGCWCKPKACHGDVLKRFVDRKDIEIEKL